MIFGRRAKSLPVLAELTGARGSRSRAWALGRADLEAMRGLLQGLDGDGQRAVLVSGGEKGVGPVAAGLAAAAIATGQRVALVECELARPRLATTLGIEAGPGLSEYLRGEAEAPQILQSLVPAGPASRHALDPLVCVVAGAPDGERDELLASDHFSHAAQRLRNGYDLVVFAGPWLDATPALRAVAEHADTALVCVPPERLQGRSGKAIAAAARALPVPVAGAVVIGGDGEVGDYDEGAGDEGAGDEGAGGEGE